MILGLSQAELTPRSRRPASHKAIGKQLNCIFVNNGLLRKRGQRVQDLFGRNFDMKLIYVDATDRFLGPNYRRREPEAQAQNHRPRFVKVF